ncbi:hypothetical protein GQ457_03G002480 [Hibiscus cannabinus]
MEIEKKPRKPETDHFLSSVSSSSMTMTILLVLFLYVFVSCPASVFAANVASFTPQDNILIDCGADSRPQVPDGRAFKTDKEASDYLKTKNDVQVSVSAIVPSPIYLNAKVFPEEATYSFTLKRPGYHWVRLHFFAMEDKQYDLRQATFSVSVNRYALLHNFKISNNSKPVLKEYLLNMNDPTLTLKFEPMKNSFAFINAIEVVSVPDSLITDEGTSLLPVNKFSSLTKHAYQVIYRINMGGPLITSKNDTLGRTWIPDAEYLEEKNSAKEASTSVSFIRYPTTVTPLIAPATVYSTLTEMGDASKASNVSWKFNVDRAFDYLLRMHFCDIVSKSVNELYFNVYINGRMAISKLDLSTLGGTRLAVPYYKDIVVNSSLISDGLKVQVGPLTEETGKRNAILNGLEVMKMSNSADSLAGEFAAEDGGESGLSHKGMIAVVGIAMAFGASLGLGAMMYKWKKRPQDWQKRNSFSSWLLPLHVGDHSYLSKGSGSQKTNLCTGLGRHFTLADLQEATKNFDSSVIIGVGGFGNVYLGTIDEGTQVAVKRANPQSEQGIAEFNTEIQMLSKLRHRHLVSLIGYCDENDEMILVYEYMSNGPFRDHLYGKNLPPLSWKQRLQICIGAARGLHYLHTVLLESLCARPAINPQLPREQVNLADWAMQWKRKDLLEKVIDPHLVGSINPESMKKFAEAAEKCLAESGVDRPPMGDVLWHLEYALQLQEAFEGKLEDETKSSDASGASQPSIVVASATPIDPVYNPEDSRGSAEVQSIGDHSETAMFAQFQSLNGR